MKKVYISTTDNFSCLFDGDFIDVDEDNGLLKVWNGNVLSGAFRMDIVSKAYITEQKRDLSKVYIPEYRKESE